ncbi:MAG: cytochrome c biogenesis protein CcdA [bacterium]|nr:cytochrome c biogenesis protein CcdA [bacterium]
MFDVSFQVAFVSGVFSFFAPCVVPLLPAYIGYVTGVSVKDLQTFGFGKYRTKLIISSLFYVLGFSLVFVILGTAAAGLGQLLRGYEGVVRVIGGMIIVILGLNFAGVLPIRALSGEHRLKPPSWAQHLGYGRAFLVGVIFATAWTPCVGAILGAILSLAAVSQTATTGALLLFVYSLGISIPFLVVALTLAHAPKYVRAISRYTGPISRIAGLLLALLGLLLLTNTYRFVNGWIFDLAFKLGYQIK